MEYMIGIIIILAVVCFFLIKGNIAQKKENKKLLDVISCWEALSKKTAEVENEKTDIRNEYEEKENDIINSTNFDNGVMPINATKKSGSYRDRGGKVNTSNS